MRYSFCTNIAQNSTMKVMYSAMVYMFNAIKVIDNSMTYITYAWILNECRLWGLGKPETIHNVDTSVFDYKTYLNNSLFNNLNTSTSSNLL